MVADSRSSTAERSTASGRGPVLWRVAVVVVVAAAGAFVYVARTRPIVEWTAVLEAVAARETMHGRGRVFSRDGTEWDYALWARIEGRGRCTAKGMVRAVKVRPGEELSAGLPPELPMLCNAMEYCGEEGVVTRMEGGRTRARRGEWGGQGVLIIEMGSREALGEAGEGHPDLWRFLLDPETKLVRGVELFMIEDGQRKLRARCEYEYGLALPPGFEEAPG